MKLNEEDYKLARRFIDSLYDTFDKEVVINRYSDAVSLARIFQKIRLECKK